MDQRERAGDPEEAIRSALDDLQARLWTQSPGIIESVDVEKQTCSVQLAIQGQIQDKDTGDWKDTNITVLVDCPILILSGGGLSITFPIKKDDECIVFFAKNTIDAWWQNGGVQPMGRYRVHDLSDGFVLVGPRSQPRKLTDYNPDKLQIRKDDGTAFIEMDAGGVVNMVVPTLHVTGNLFVDGNISAGNGITGSFTTLTGQVAMFIKGIFTGLV